MTASTVVVVAVLAILLQVSLQGWIVGAATTHVVGGSTGWTIPPNNTFYPDWASSQTFLVGDILQFNFETGMHDVVAVTKSGYDACDSNGQIASPVTSGPASIPLSSAGEHYYLCGITGHCSAGQKLAVSVVSSTPDSGDAPSPSSGGGSSPPSGSAGALVAPPSLVAVGLSLLLVNINNALR
ncbi:hypothetical protein J5N97_013238 [Dioscorea zingiberensis]|uniref:Phytocyanin domain-containing protein n=1 Tax=Dioscorea zingiberensis TaxID=325984 RepID=A0A9D5HIK4_9LILI|nr:hypothetical protein J5N97_013238 [Dioscorea zingiberensis]